MNTISVIVWSWFSCSKWTEGKFHWDENRSGLKRINVRNQLGLCEATAQRVCSWARLHFPPCPRRVFPAGNTLSTLCAPELCWQAVQVSPVWAHLPKAGNSIPVLWGEEGPEAKGSSPNTHSSTSERGIPGSKGQALPLRSHCWAEGSRAESLHSTYERWREWQERFPSVQQDCEQNRRLFFQACLQAVWVKILIGVRPLDYRRVTLG